MTFFWVSGIGAALVAIAQINPRVEGVAYIGAFMLGAGFITAIINRE